MPIFGALMGFSLLFGSAVSPLGSTAEPVPPAASSAPATPSYPVKLTAYNAVPSQTDDNPFETASGAYSNPEIIAARSQNLADKLPFGTIIELDGSNVSSGDTCGFDTVAPLIGYRVIEDTMNARYTNRIDVLLGTDANYTMPDGTVMNAANVLGICKGVTFRIIGHVDINHLPKTQAALVALVAKGSALALR
jgi:3D (Asp-Asp-Asp) domain-containing protein